ncbi:ABC transporter permease [Pseudophaeobacter sp.]|uniref:ABC transporter permease n=1 Tax=Pseudophaeobacter sp. TaxID=1971739 RepID=UPI0040586BEB
MKHLWSVALGVGLCFVIWWAASLRFSDFIVPAPKDTAAALIMLLVDGAFWTDTLLPTLLRAASGGAIAAIVGIVLGLWAGQSIAVNGIVTPLRFVLLALPAPVFVILALLWVGAQDATIILSVAVLLAPVFFVAARDGLRGTDIRLTEMAQVYRVTWLHKCRYILMPSVGVSLIPATRLAIANALRLTILAEILVATGGMGEQISLSRQYLETPQLFAMVVILIAIIAALEQLLNIVFPSRAAA